MPTVTRSAIIVCITFHAFGLFAIPAAAEPPTVSYFFPAGGKRGTSVAVTADGKFPTWPPKIWVDSEQVKVTTSEEKGKLTFAISANARPGRHWIRFFDESGSSRLRPFVVGCVAEKIETDASETKPDDQKTTGLIDLGQPVTVNGRLAANDEVDTYPIVVQPGEEFVASLDAYRYVGSPMDTVMQLYDVDNQVVLAQVDDAPGKDPRIVWPPERSPTYSSNLAIRLFAFPETPNQRIGFTGANNFVYRLTISARGFVDFVTPLAISESRLDTARLFGWSLGDDAHSSDVRFADNARTATIFRDGVPGFANIRIQSTKAVSEETDCTVEQPLSLSLPTTVTGWIQDRGDVDAFSFTAKKGAPIALTVEARNMGFPTDPLLEIFDDQKKRLNRTDDNKGRDCSISFKPPKDGIYTATVRDLYGHSSARHRYLLTVKEQEPAFRLEIANELNSSKVGTEHKIDVNVIREGGMSDEIYIAALGLSNVVTNPVTSKPDGDSSKKVTLTLNASQATSGPFQIVGTTSTSQHAIRAETPAVVPNTRITSLWFAAVEPEPSKEDASKEAAE